jgi:ribosome-binding factor A
MNTRRQRQVAELLHEEIGTLIQRRARDPRLSAVTVTGVEVSSDLENAWIYVSVLGTDEEIKEALAGLKRATPFLRREVGSSLSLRLVPQLIFRLDESVARGIRIDQLLDDIQSAEPHSHQTPNDGR